MIKYIKRKDSFKDDEGAEYISYGVDAYEGNKKVKSIKDITPDKEQMERQIEIWNRCQIGLEHFDQVVQTFINNDYVAEEKPYSQV